MAGETENRDHGAPSSDTSVKRRWLLRFGTLITAFTGASAISALGASSAEAGPGDKTPSTAYVPTSEKGAPLGVATLDMESKIPPALLPDLSATYASVPSVTRADVNAYLQGARGDYTGRYGTVGTGTDSRAAIQAALNAASDVTDTTYYGYLSRRSTTVRLSPGTYIITAPSDGTASLKVPAGVLFDTSDALILFDYPAAATKKWCGIEVHQYGQLKIGKLTTSGRVAAPDTALVYDGVRLVHTDNNTRVIGYADSEIRGFHGAQIRGVGAWISYIKGIRFYSGKLGYVASNGSEGNDYGYAIASGGATRRVQTDLRFEDCQFINEGEGGFLGTTRGTSPDVNAADNSDSGLTLSFIGCVFESIGTYALHITNAFTVTIIDCGIEECGKGDGMIWLDNVRTFNAIGTRINLAGRTVPGPNGTTNRPYPSTVFKVTSVQNFTVDGMYCHNSWNASLTLADNTATVGYRVSGILSDSYDFATGPMYQGKGTLSIRGRWDQAMLAISGHRLWTDTSGVLRHKASAPASDTDGDAYLNSKAVAVPLISGTAYVVTAGQLGTTSPAEAGEQAVPFIAGRSTTLTTVAVSVTTAGSAGALVRLGLRAANGSQPGTLLADGGTVDASTTGTKQVTISQALIEGVLYFATVSIQGAAATRPTLQAASGAHDSRIGNKSVATALSSTYVALNASGTTTTGALPTTQAWSPGSTAVRLAVIAS